MDIENWRNELERVLANTDREITALSNTKDNCDHAYAQKAIPESVVAECLGNFSIERLTALSDHSSGNCSGGQNSFEFLYVSFIKINSYFSLLK